MKQKLILMMAGLFLMGLILPASAAEMKWGYVDLPTAMRSVDKGKKIYEKLKAMKDQKQKDLEKEEAALRAASEDLKKQQNVLSQEALIRRNKELAQKQIELQRKAENYEMELGEAQNEYAKDILGEMDKVIKEIAAKEGLDIIFEKSSSKLLYADSKKDLTDQVVSQYNKTFGGDLKKKK